MQRRATTGSQSPQPAPSNPRQPGPLSLSAPATLESESTPAPAFTATAIDHPLIQLFEGLQLQLRNIAKLCEVLKDKTLAPEDKEQLTASFKLLQQMELGDSTNGLLGIAGRISTDSLAKSVSSKVIEQHTSATNILAKYCVQPLDKILSKVSKKTESISDAPLADQGLVQLLVGEVNAAFGIAGKIHEFTDKSAGVSTQSKDVQGEVRRLASSGVVSRNRKSGVFDPVTSLAQSAPASVTQKKAEPIKQSPLSRSAVESVEIFDDSRRLLDTLKSDIAKTAEFLRGLIGVSQPLSKSAPKKVTLPEVKAAVTLVNDLIKYHASVGTDSTISTEEQTIIKQATDQLKQFQAIVRDPQNKDILVVQQDVSPEDTAADDTSLYDVNALLESIDGVLRNFPWSSDSDQDLSQRFLSPQPGIQDKILSSSNPLGLQETFLRPKTLSSYEEFSWQPLSASPKKKLDPDSQLEPVELATIEQTESPPKQQINRSTIVEQAQKLSTQSVPGTQGKAVIWDRAPTSQSATAPGDAQPGDIIELSTNSVLAAKTTSDKVTIATIEESEKPASQPINLQRQQFAARILSPDQERDITETGVPIWLEHNAEASAIPPPSSSSRSPSPAPEPPPHEVDTQSESPLSTSDSSESDTSTVIKEVQDGLPQSDTDYDNPVYPSDYASDYASHVSYRSRSSSRSSSPALVRRSSSAPPQSFLEVDPVQSPRLQQPPAYDLLARSPSPTQMPVVEKPFTPPSGSPDVDMVSLPPPKLEVDSGSSADDESPPRKRRRKYRKPHDAKHALPAASQTHPYSPVSPTTTTPVGTPASPASASATSTPPAATPTPAGVANITHILAFIMAKNKNKLHELPMSYLIAIDNLLLQPQNIREIQIPEISKLRNSGVLDPSNLGNGNAEKTLKEAGIEIEPFKASGNFGLKPEDIKKVKDMVEGFTVIDLFMTVNKVESESRELAQKRASEGLHNNGMFPSRDHSSRSTTPDYYPAAPVLISA